MRWYGWLWNGAAWERACQADSLGECARLLAQECDARRVEDRHSCMTGGAAPTFTPADKPGRRPVRRRF